MSSYVIFEIVNMNTVEPREAVNPSMIEETKVFFVIRVNEKHRRVNYADEEEVTNVIEEREISSTSKTFDVDFKYLFLLEALKQGVSYMLSEMNIQSEIHQVLAERISSFGLDSAYKYKNTKAKRLTIMVEIEVVTVEEFGEEEELRYQLLRELMDNDNGQIGFGAIPAARSSIEALERKKFDGGDLREVVSCVICFQEFSMGMEVTCMPCSHSFHKGCIERWLELSNLCPLCRSQLPI